MGGAAALAFAGMYFYVQNVTNDLKKKLKTYNMALTHLQEERANLIVKTENMFSENASQDAHLANMNEENKILRGAIERLETDNHLLAVEYKKLEELLFVANG
jgi:predicted nuclease with TOPRIM domain